MRLRLTAFPLARTFVLAFVLCGLLAPAQAQQAPAHAWTLDTAVQQLRLYPRDAYLQYVVLQLATREGRLNEVSREFAALSASRFRRGPDRSQDVDLFSIFSGALAVQESLQLDTMVGGDDLPGAAPTLGAPPTVLLADLVGPTIKSHPWDSMLRGRSPAVSPLASCVPADFLFVQFRSVSKLLQALRLSDHWGAYVVSQMRQEARSQLVVDRFKQQLAVETSDLLGPLYDAVIDELAITSSDIYFRDGTDVTLLMRLKQPELFRAQMDQFLLAAEQNTPGARRSEGTCLEIPYVHVTSPDRSVHVYSAYPLTDLHVRSNSRAALERILEAVTGRTAQGEACDRLGDTAEFKFIRTIMEQGAVEEDGFVYLSDPFVRRLMGPHVKLAQRQRALCYNHLRMIGHAGLLHLTESGRAATSLEALAAANCLPVGFGRESRICPAGGTYALAADGLTGVCSQHGHARFLTPCLELPLKEVTSAEAQQYKMFVERYNQYWRTFFDPIAIRFQMTPKSYRLETIVLPLIDNSIYTNLATALGGRPEPLDGLPVPERNIFSVAARLDKGQLLRRLGLEEWLAELEPQEPARPQPPPSVESLKLLGLALHNFHDSYRQFPPAPGRGGTGKSQLSWRVHVLPFVEQAELYQQFHLDEPWDSDHNKPLIGRMPLIFRPANPQLAAQGKTTLVAPRAAGTMHADPAQGSRFADIRDGASNTIMLVETSDENAVIWTKPDDVEIDLAKPRARLATHPPESNVVLFADGSVRMFRASLPDKALAAMFTHQGGEAIEDYTPHEVRIDFRSHHRFPDEEFVRGLQLGKFLSRGIGNQVSLHVCDADPLVDFNVASFLGMMVGSFQGGRMMDVFDEEGLFALLAIAINVPVYVAVPVQDAEVVDASLRGLDQLLTTVAQRGIGPNQGFFRIEQDFYQFNPRDDANVRSYAFAVGPLKWRFFWARIGRGLYVASKPFIIEDLLALEAQAGSAAPAGKGPEAHGMVRVRPLHWSRVLPQYRIGWAENQRRACLHNLGPLSSLSRGWSAQSGTALSSTEEPRFQQLARQLYDARFFCPDGGRYVVAPDGNSVSCTVHGSAAAPRQPLQPSDESRLGALLRDFADLTLALTFLEDGLHAVVTLERN